jgi:hypothetical protein
LLPGGSVVELLDGSLLQPTITMVADMTPMMIAFFISFCFLLFRAIRPLSSVLWLPVSHFCFLLSQFLLSAFTLSVSFPPLPLQTALDVTFSLTDTFSAEELGDW